MSGATSAPSITSSSSTSLCCSGKPRRVGTSRHSRSILLLASVGVTALFFALDSERIGQRSWPAELCCYAAGLLVAAVYARLVGTSSKSTAKSSQQVDLCGCFLALCGRIRLTAEAGKTKVRACVNAVRRLRLTPPEGRLFSSQMVRTTAVILVTLLAPMLFLPFLADMSGDADACSRMMFFDAAPKQVCIEKPGTECPPWQGFSIRSTTWLVVAFLMSSGLCAVHPLQSGLLMAF